MHTHDAVIVGAAGPIGIELAVALKKAGLDYTHLDAGQIGQTMFDWTPQTRWFSSPDRIAIAGVPIQTVTQSKCTREEYLAYLRAVVLQHQLVIRSFERVTSIGRDDGGFTLATETLAGARHEVRARRVILATGGNAIHNRLGIPGEDLPHVAHLLEDPHRYFGRRLLIVGGRNSAAEAALRCHHAAARVTLSYRGDAFPRSVKYWIRPELEHLIETGGITAHFRTRPLEITTEAVRLEPVDGGETLDVAADFVVLLTGYTADMSLFRDAGVTLTGELEVPVFNEQTMETDVPDLYVAGTAVAGTQRSGVKVFLENCHIHVDRIVAAITGNAPPATPDPIKLAEA